MRAAAMVAAGLLGLGVLGAAPARAEHGDWAVSVEGGVGDYTGALGSSLNTGGTWGLRVERMATSVLQLGLAYVGSANQIAGMRNENGSRPVLQRDGGELSLKALLLEGWLRPYVEAGAGLARFHVRQGEPGPDLQSSTSLVLPLAVGVQAHAGVVRVGAGLGYETFVAGNPARRGGGQRLNGQLSLGATF
ncbi:MAG: hypothetical protein HY901_37470 [Deltaproteobacteria bacterium]|nr:hypothetical protein [Deltaproteobacteria bacterium]